MGWSGITCSFGFFGSGAAGGSGGDGGFWEMVVLVLRAHLA